MTRDYFTYNPGSFPPDSFRISPSQFSKFFDQTHEWWAIHAYGEDPAFQGSTASELGTCVHAAAAMYFDTRTIDHAAISDYISTLGPDIDTAEIRAQYPIMAQALISGFLASNLGTESESFVSTETAPGIYLAGSIDMFDAKRQTIVDYKTIGSLDSARVPSSFPRTYYFQQLCYAYIMRANGHTVTTLKLVYISRSNTGRISEKTGKPLQDYPSTVSVLSHIITPDDWSLIESCVKLVTESIQAWQQHPELRHIICQDYRRKVKPKPRLFINQD